MDVIVVIISSKSGVMMLLCINQSYCTYCTVALFYNGLTGINDAKLSLSLDRPYTATINQSISKSIDQSIYIHNFHSNLPNYGWMSRSFLANALSKDTFPLSLL